MPALSDEVIEVLRTFLINHLAQKGNYSSPEFVAAGGSAAVFKCTGPLGPRAFKVFDPKFLTDERSAPEIRRLDLQRTLINHDCPNLVQTFSVDILKTTAIIEMELIDWPQLKEILHDFPDQFIPQTINQIISAVTFLESKGIVHRDIKPENIHISPDYNTVKLLDLGVAREFDGDPDGAITDHNGTRPFIATAQYSSPEYLFRLDAPSKDLWNALNIYQVGAVLHDLIMKKEIFSEEVKLENRWLIARAVLSKTPSLDDGIVTRLSMYKALACRCLSKDMQTRLQTVCWDDFQIEPTCDPLQRLRATILKSKSQKSITALAEASAKLDWLRAQHWEKLATQVRSLIQSTCKADLPSRIAIPTTATSPITIFFTLGREPEETLQLTISIFINWLSSPQERIANLSSISKLSSGKSQAANKDAENEQVCSTTIDCNIEEDARNISQHIAKIIQQAIAIYETVEKLESPVILRSTNDRESI